MIPIEISSIDERFFRQAYETLYAYINDIKYADTLSAYNHSINKSGICPTLTTRPDGFKTAIMVVDEYDCTNKIK